MPKGIYARHSRAESWFRQALTHGTDDCIVSPYVTSDGYGSYTRQYQHHAMHIEACEIRNGPMPRPGMQATHTCGVRACVNPRHMLWGTHKSNYADAVRHGTSCRGERHGCAKLTWADVRSIRARATAGLVRGDLTSIGREYGVSRSSISLIINNRIWKESP